MKKRIIILFVLLFLGLSLQAGDLDAFFRRNCVKCHGAEKQKGKLRLDNRRGNRPRAATLTFGRRSSIA